jgi:hypothetical protein
MAMAPVILASGSVVTQWHDAAFCLPEGVIRLGRLSVRPRLR